MADLVFGVIDQHQRKNNPSEYINEYGKTDEVVFMTFLRNILVQQNVFRSIELTTDLKMVKPQDVLIKVYFKTARVVNVDFNKLTVMLSIKSARLPIYEKTYFVENDPKSEARTFVDKKTEVSEGLLNKIIGSIKQWYEENKK